MKDIDFADQMRALAQDIFERREQYLMPPKHAVAELFHTAGVCGEDLYFTNENDTCELRVMVALMMAAIAENP